MRTSKRNKNKHSSKKTLPKQKKLTVDSTQDLAEQTTSPEKQQSNAVTHTPTVIHVAKEKNSSRRNPVSYPFTHRNTRTVLIILSCYAVFSLWIMQNSVNAYYTQTYHRESPLTALNQWSIWRWGGYVGDALNQTRDYINQEFASVNKYSVELHNKNVPVPADIIDNMINTADNTLMIENTEHHTAHISSEHPKTSEQIKTDDISQSSGLLTQAKIDLTANDEIFFAGDSMMQGVAPHLQKNLQQYKIKSINLSKQSTGLSYPKFFNWPNTIADTLKHNPKIKVLVIFLGPNDPWDIINPRTGKYIKFQTAEWENTYRSRMAEILNTAQQHQVKVIWISPPNMKKASLNQQMIYLNQVMAEEMKLHDAIWIDSRPLVGGKNDIYHDYLVKNGQNIKMRSGDGIHFSLQGQKEMARIIQQYLNIMQ